MQATLGLLAEYANVTGDGKLNIMGIFNKINAPALPHVHPSCHLIVQLEFQPVEIGRKRKMEIVFQDADGATYLKLGGDFSVPRGDEPGPVYLNHIVALNGLRFTTLGDYVFNVLVDDELKKTVSLRVVKAPEASTS